MLTPYIENFFDLYNIAIASIERIPPDKDNQKEIENRVPCNKEDKNMRMILTMHISLYPHK